MVQFLPIVVQVRARRLRGHFDGVIGVYVLGIGILRDVLSVPITHVKYFGTIFFRNSTC